MQRQQAPALQRVATLHEDVYNRGGIGIGTEETSNELGLEG